MTGKNVFRGFILLKLVKKGINPAEILSKGVRYLAEMCSERYETPEK
jgi:hypothetical protein